MGGRRERRRDNIRSGIKRRKLMIRMMKRTTKQEKVDIGLERRGIMNESGREDKSKMI